MSEWDDSLRRFRQDVINEIARRAILANFPEVFDTSPGSLPTLSAMAAGYGGA